ncbi:TPA: DUF3265 domain-containing protein [Vibrio parahaemolyticus]|nr:DUF3265 domain-containing protein [Vibrio parahaemolyticus]EJG0640907.1 DUF3265 domain-containing protein [Vibrio parahaemolyticus]EJG0687762.1 DUF3265 domain-containing protein [Vibrio parahaemolyticus]EJG0702204.1 DUF3265 domain-containing protein [Vibrio parahaemolyticus]EJG0730882.1 DUF3265 domain-containing protein [Vibrio parahaemolyticus]
MRNAWHFYCALVLVIKVVCGDIGIALAHPLTRRYVFLTKGVVNEKAYD